MQDKIEGIIISEKNYGESSKIINILTRDYGIIGVMVKGARKLKSNLRTSSSKLIHGIFYMNYKKDKLSILTNVDVISNFKNIMTDISKISYANYMLDLASQVSHESDNPLIFDNLIDTLNKLNEGFDELVLSSILEIKYLDYLGVMPYVDGCSVCGRKEDIVTLSTISGGYICKDCLTSEQILNNKTVKLLRMLYYVDIKKITKLNIGLDIKSELHTFLEEYYDTYTGIYLKSKTLLNELSKLN